MSKHIEQYHALPLSRDEFFDDFFRGRFPSLFNERHNAIQFPKVNVSEDDHAVIVTANVPGIAAKDITIEVEGGSLTLSGHVEREETEGKKDSDFYRFEREEGSFMRTIALPSPVDREKIEAQTKNGVLTVTLPKLKGTEKQKIHIKEA